VSKPGDKPPAETAGQWEELTLESTRTLKARVFVPAKPSAPAAPSAAQPAAAQAVTAVAKPAAATAALDDLFTLESTISAQARVLPAAAAKAAAVEAPAAVVVPPPEPPRRQRLSTSELHALSVKIKAEREKAAAPPPKK
jgi:hypothetical protein